MNSGQKVSPDLKHIDVVILCGGFGKRLKSIISDRPKPMAEIEGKPFIQFLIECFSNFGIERFILCTGYKDNIIRQYFQDRYGDKEILISKEDKPLGTGGSLRHAIHLIENNPFFVINGDSFCKLNIYDFYKFHVLKKALVSIALVKVKNTEKFGYVNVDTLGSITKFDEKNGSIQEGLINAGIYLMNRDIFSYLKEYPNIFSLEHDLFPGLINKGLFGMKSDCQYFMDIGTPESFFRAQKLLKKAFNT